MPFFLYKEENFLYCFFKEKKFKIYVRRRSTNYLFINARKLQPNSVYDTELKYTTSLINDTNYFPNAAQLVLYHAEYSDGNKYIPAIIFETSVSFRNKLLNFLSGFMIIL